MPKQPKNADVEENDAKTAQKKSCSRKKVTAKKTESDKKKRGSPSLYIEKIFPHLKDIERYIRCGVKEGELAKYYNVGKTSWAKYKKENPELDETVNNAKQTFKTEIINRAYQVAMGYEYTETTTVTITNLEGKPVGEKTTTYKKYAKADAGMLQFLLINRLPDEFARDPQILELRRKALELAAQGKTPVDMEGI